MCQAGTIRHALYFRDKVELFAVTDVDVLFGFMLSFGVGLFISFFLVWASGFVGLFLFSYFLSGSIFARPLYFPWSVATSIWSPVYADSRGCTPVGALGMLLGWDYPPNPMEAQAPF